MFKTVIAGYSRSPFTMARKGELIDIKPVNLLAKVVNNLVSKTIETRLTGWQLESFKESYVYKIQNGMSLFKKKLVKE